MANEIKNKSCQLTNGLLRVWRGIPLEGEGCGHSPAAGRWWGGSWGGERATEAGGKGDGFEAGKVPNPQKLLCRFHSLSGVWSRASRVPQTAGSFLPASPRTSGQTVPQGGRVGCGAVGLWGSWGSNAVTRRLRGWADLEELLAQVWFILCLGRRRNLIQQHVLESFWDNPVRISPSSSAAKLRRKRTRKEGGTEMGQGELVSVENKSHRSKLPWGMNFPVWHLPPPFCLTVHADGNPPVRAPCPPPHGAVPLSRARPTCETQGGSRGAAVTRCLPHPEEQPSFPLSVTLLWGMFGN